MAEEEFDVEIKHIDPVKVALRRYSGTKCMQGNEETCKLHAYSKLLIQNVANVLIGLRLTREENKQYSDCIKKSPIETHLERKIYTPEQCSYNGYRKIMLFFYFYDYFVDAGKSHSNKPIVELISDMAEHVNPSREEPPNDIELEMKEILYDHRNDFNWINVLYSLHDIGLDDLTKHILPLVFNLNLYVRLSLRRTKQDGNVSKHAVLLVGMNAAQYYIKNSWGDFIDIVPIRSTITLRRQTYKINQVHFILPIKGDLNTSGPITTWIDEYAIRARQDLPQEFINDRLVLDPTESAESDEAEAEAESGGTHTKRNKHTKRKHAKRRTKRKKHTKRKCSL